MDGIGVFQAQKFSFQLSDLKIEAVGCLALHPYSTLSCLWLWAPEVNKINK